MGVVGGGGGKAFLLSLAVMLYSTPFSIPISLTCTHAI